MSAAHYLEAAHSLEAAKPTADRLSSLELRRLAADQYLGSGHFESGLPILAELCRSQGIPFPRTPTEALIRERWGRMRAHLSGLGRRLESVDAGARVTDRDELFRLDLCLSAGFGISLADAVLGSYFASAFLLRAPKAGDTPRLVMAAAGELVSSAASGGSGIRRAKRLLKLVEPLSKRVGDLDVEAAVLSLRGLMHWFAGEWASTHACTTRALELYRESSKGLGWPRSTANIFALSGLCLLGEWRNLERQLPALVSEARDRGDDFGAVGMRLMPYSYVVDLLNDRPDLGEARIQETLAWWKPAGDTAFHIQHCDAMFGRVDLALYDGQPRLALTTIEKAWPRLDETHQLHYQVTRVFAHALRARAALAHASSAETDRGPMLRGTLRDISAIEGEKLAWASGWALLLRAGVAAVTKERRSALGLLDRAVDALEAADMPQYASAARWRSAGLQGKTPEPDALMAKERVQRPDRLANMLRQDSLPIGGATPRAPPDRLRPSGKSSTREGAPRACRGPYAERTAPFSTPVAWPRDCSGAHGSFPQGHRRTSRALAREARRPRDRASSGADRIRPWTQCSPGCPKG